MQLAVWLLQQIARSSTGCIFHQPFTVINFKGEKLYFCNFFFSFMKKKGFFQICIFEIRFSAISRDNIWGTGRALRILGVEE